MNSLLPHRKIGLLTSGGDAPGMNAAIRAVVRSAGRASLEVVGVIGGYAGLLESQWRTLDSRDMGNILQRGGTILKTGRCFEFLQPEARAKAAANLRQAEIDALVVIGGNGSFMGAHLLASEQKIPVVGIPGTIDNDIDGTDASIGFDTAVNTALDAIDKIRDTATSHDRLFIVEVMGRNSGFLASAVGLAGGAEEIFIPELPLPLDRVAAKIKASALRGKRSSILIAGEGQKPGRAYDLAEQLRKKSGLDAKVCILGHQQRGGSPSAADRILACRLGAAAVDTLVQGESNLMMGVQASRLVRVPLIDAAQKTKNFDKEFWLLASALA
jgi:6-phosphofructokinase 1